MELSDVLLTASILLPATYVVQKNMQAYGETLEWLVAHNVPPIWNEQANRNLRDASFLGRLNYYFCYPGRRLAYMQYQKKRT